MTAVAGHYFVSGICICGVRWCDIRNATEDDIGRQGIAHVAHLTAEELSQIWLAREAEDAAILRAMESVS